MIYNKTGQTKRVLQYFISLFCHTFVSVVVTFYKTETHQKHAENLFPQTNKLKWGTLPDCLVCYVTGSAVRSFSSVPLKPYHKTVSLCSFWFILAVLEAPALVLKTLKYLCFSLVFSSRISVLFNHCLSLFLLSFFSPHFPLCLKEIVSVCVEFLLQAPQTKEHIGNTNSNIGCTHIE